MFFQTASTKLPNGQDWLIDRMIALEYESDAEGICFGFSYMVMQAVLAGEFNQFYRRLQLINDIPVEKIKERMEQIKAKQAALVKDIKIENSKLFDTLSKNEMEVLENDPDITIKLEMIRKMVAGKLKLNDKEKKAEFEIRKKDVLRNAFFQMKIDDAYLHLPDEERLILTIPAFFEGVEIYHNVEMYPDLFTQDERPSEQDSLLSLSLTLPGKLEKQGGIVEVDKFSGVYDKDSMKAYLDILAEEAAKISPPMEKPLTLL